MPGSRYVTRKEMENAETMPFDEIAEEHHRIVIGTTPLNVSSHAHNFLNDNLTSLQNSLALARDAARQIRATLCSSRPDKSNATTTAGGVGDDANSTADTASSTNTSSVDKAQSREVR